MSLWVAFLCGINVGKRQMKMADLKETMETAGFTKVKTILASGNVRFESSLAEKTINARLEKIISGKYGFAVTVILRTGAKMESLLKNHPFAELDPKADLHRHVILFRDRLPRVEIESRPGDTEILRIDDRELYFAGYRQPSGRYTENVEEVLAPLYKKLGKSNPNTGRNWNTIEKVLA